MTSRTMAWSSGLSFSKARRLTTMVPVTYSSGVSVRYFTRVCHCRAMAPTGVVATVSMRPVCRAVSTSVMASWMVEMPNWAKASWLMRSPSGIQILRAARSAVAVTGLRDMR